MMTNTVRLFRKVKVCFRPTRLRAAEATVITTAPVVLRELLSNVGYTELAKAPPRAVTSPHFVNLI